MPPSPAIEPFSIFLTDPIIFMYTLVPIIVLAGALILLVYRIRATRRLARLTDRSEARWQESAARTDAMIKLLTEIRDHLANNAPNAPRSPTADS